MNKKMLTIASLGLMTLGLMGAAKADDGKLESKSGKDVTCTAKIQIKNGLDQTVQIDSLRMSSSSDKGFFTEYTLGGSKYRPVTGATVSTPSLDVKVPAGHKLATEVVYRTQKTAGKNPTFSAPKTQTWGPSAIQAGCSLAGQTLNVMIN